MSPLLARTEQRIAPPPPAAGDRRLGAILAARGSVSPADLSAALVAQNLSHAPLGEILRLRGSVSSDTVTGALAAQAGLIAVDLARMPPDPALEPLASPDVLLRLGFVGWRRLDGTPVAAISDPQAAEAVRAATGLTDMGVVLADRRQVEDAIAARHGADINERSRVRCPKEMSCRSLFVGRRGLAAAILLSLAAGIVTAPAAALSVLLVWVLIATFATSGLRLFAFLASFFPSGQASRPAATGGPLPRVSILVPLLREDVMVRQLIAAIGRSTYPKELLEVILVLEPEDVRTPIALAQIDLPPWVRVLTTPPDSLKTKPRALNYALTFCRGDIVGVYDAEDRPERDQLSIIAAQFASAPPEVACIQGYLDFYNTRQNWLSRCFTIEYAIWFRVLLKGVARLGIPIPLGGTTVFLRRATLVAVGGWDSHNVTEDADLGMRLARRGYRTEMAPTTTFEEANCRPGAWIVQRSRWLKGYMVTWATHMRRPLSLWRDLGTVGFLGFQVLFLGAVTAYLSAPLFWLMWAGTLGFGLPVADFLPAGLWPVAIHAMLAGQALMLAVAARAVWARKRRHLLAIVPTLALYWPLGALAAYRALAELAIRPFHWSKTRHGL